MPLHLSPVVEAPLEAPVLRPRSPLQAAYGASGQAMAVQVIAPEGTPIGLAQLLARMSPGLPQHLDLPALAAADRQALSVLTAQGWLTVMPDSGIQPSDQVGLAVWDGMDPGSAAPGQISLDPDVAATFGRSVAHPVLFRWLALFHEAGHLQMARDPNGFAHPAWSAEENQAMDALLRGPLGRSGQDVAQFYAEAYADAFAVLALWQLGGDTPAIRKSLAEWHSTRRADEQEGRRATDHHATSAMLGRLLAALETQGAPSSWSPASARDQARRWASEATLEWIQRHPAAQTTLLAEALPSHPDEAALQRMGRAQAERLSRYLNVRLLAYAQSSPLAAQPATGGDPLLDALACQDARFQDQFNRLVTAHDRQVILDFLMRPALPVAEQRDRARAMDGLLVVKALQQAMLATSVAFLQADPEAELAFQRRLAQPVVQALGRDRLRRRP